MDRRGARPTRAIRWHERLHHGRWIGPVADDRDLGPGPVGFLPSAREADPRRKPQACGLRRGSASRAEGRSEEHTSELQSQSNLVCRLLLEKKKKKDNRMMYDNCSV